jgi:acetyltransferase-like isoleucine patch superfamily enzyme
LIWEPCNIYPSAIIGEDVNIGAFTEIGPNVVIGDGVRIGAMCFIPEGVTIEADAWIGPRCTFTNDKYPPSGKENWKPIRVCKEASIGAAVTILPGVTVGEGAKIGAGSVVTKDVPNDEKWCGVPAKKMEKE